MPILILALDADGADTQGDARLLRSKDALDRRAYFRAGPLVPPIHRLALVLPEMDHRLEPGEADFGFIFR
jgi:hypothetical protein